MSRSGSQWQTRKRAQLFSEGVRGAIPGAELQLEILSKIVRQWRPRPSRILDLGCGDGILGRTLMHEYPTAQVLFADFSEPMLEKLRVKIAAEKRAMAVNADFARPEWTKALEPQKRFDIIVSGFAIHHQPDGRKKELYAEIHELLTEGGIFLNLDQVSSATAEISEIFDSFFLAHIRRFLVDAGLEESMKAVREAYYQDKQENIPAPVERQCRWLGNIGFQQVDCFFKTFELALFGGRKTSSRAPAAKAGRSRQPSGSIDPLEK